MEGDWHKRRESWDDAPKNPISMNEPGTSMSLSSGELVIAQGCVKGNENEQVE